MDIINAIWTWILENFLLLAGAGSGTVILGILLGKVFNERRFVVWGNAAETFGAWCGRWGTLRLSTWPVLGKAWNKIVEPIVILLLNLPARFLKGFVGRKGLLSDAPK